MLYKRYNILINFNFFTATKTARKTATKTARKTATKTATKTKNITITNKILIL
jgi:hypothetical protein